MDEGGQAPHRAPQGVAHAVQQLQLPRARRRRLRRAPQLSDERGCKQAPRIVLQQPRKARLELVTAICSISVLWGGEEASEGLTRRSSLLLLLLLLLRAQQRLMAAAAARSCPQGTVAACTTAAAPLLGGAYRPPIIQLH